MKSPIPQPIRHSSDPTLKRSYPRDSVRLFKSDFLEQFTHVHPIVPALVWTPVVAYLAYRSFAIDHVATGAFFVWVVLGVLAMTLVEYLLHRFVFHFPAKSPMGERIVYIMHGLHHEDPQDPTRLVMPPLPAAIYGITLFVIFRMLFGPVYVDAFFAGFLAGYLAYDYIHYYVHHFTPKNRIGKYLKRYHMVHHFADYEAKWGVSNPLWDYVFGTVESRVPARASARGNDGSKPSRIQSA
jgi:sterol desaturase/sphingolipid hydroxylase (fatty acid hydroxylase superfamily)